MLFDTVIETLYSAFVNVLSLKKKLNRTKQHLDQN